MIHDATLGWLADQLLDESSLERRFLSTHPSIRCFHNLISNVGKNLFSFSIIFVQFQQQFLFWLETIKLRSSLLFTFSFFAPTPACLSAVCRNGMRRRRENVTESPHPKESSLLRPRGPGKRRISHPSRGGYGSFENLFRYNFINYTSLMPFFSRNEERRNLNHFKKSAVVAIDI